MSENSALYESSIPHLKLLNRGKVRDIYQVDDEHMLIVANDRLSALMWCCRNLFRVKGGADTSGKFLV